MLYSGLMDKQAAYHLDNEYLSGLEEKYDFGMQLHVTTCSNIG